jgi:hypothetical protein
VPLATHSFHYQLVSHNSQTTKLPTHSH